MHPSFIRARINAKLCPLQSYADLTSFHKEVIGTSWRGNPNVVNTFSDGSSPPSSRVMRNADFRCPPFRGNFVHRVANTSEIRRPVKGEDFGFVAEGKSRVCRKDSLIGNL
jgi:hypothetical protein